MTISTAALAELLKRESGDPVILLFTITNPQLDTLYLAESPTAIVSRGTTFNPTWVNLSLATDTDDLPSMSFAIPNVDREIGLSILAVSGPLTVAVEAILASDPDDVFRRYARFELVNVKFDAIAVSGELRQARLIAEPYPKVRVTPGKFPAFFR